MAATVDIEVESGIFTGPVPLHQGYYAGDFSTRPVHADLTYTRRHSSGGSTVQR
jgi:hypothetical protein